ncbi:hypothetical protein MCHI_003339 [Candidatus Magnetoovum chiemensis]|nr:hypothetical protein MCHI_003339 [Candidatus Magnetoovum chiemensis]
MRHFHSYGPVDSRQHFYVPRRTLVENCLTYMLGNADSGGHYFTIWAPRQTGKTWLMRQVKNELTAKYSDRFIVGAMSMQGIFIDNNKSNEEAFFRNFPRLIRDTFKIKINTPKYWEDISDVFYREIGIFDRPALLFIDEFDSLPPTVIDRLVTLFRDMYLKRDAYLLHGLALIGVRAALGVESERGSPFNIQRSLHIPNFTKDEVLSLFQQYVKESAQEIAPAVIEKLYDTTKGQPGLVCWLGELLTEKYNTEINKPINIKLFDSVYHNALRIEWNNTVLNLIKKAKAKYQEYVINLFAQSDVVFNIAEDWCSYLYMNGIIDNETIIDNLGQTLTICRFSSPFVQERLYNALTSELVGNKFPIPALEILDDLSDVFEPNKLNVSALLQRYKDYLNRLKAKGLNPWKNQPRRTDLNYTEAVGHFHLYAWLQDALRRQCIVSPEFPTGNGKVDLHLRCGSIEAIIEVKSFTYLSELPAYKNQAVKYAEKLGKDEVTLALFVPSNDDDVLKRLSSEDTLNNIKITVVAIGWTT